MNKIKYSVIIPVYNSEKFIQRAIDALLDQNYSSMEIIIIDDGSIDNTENIIRTYSQDLRVKYYKQKHLGPGVARKYGIEKCNGRFVAFLDSDDYVLPGYFEELDKYVEGDTDIVEYGYIYEAQGIKKFPDIMRKENKFTYRLLEGKMTTALWPRVYRYELLRDLKHIDFYYSEDFYINFQLYRKSKKIKIINKILYCYGDNMNSLTRCKAAYKERKSNYQVREILLQQYDDLDDIEISLLKQQICYNVISLYYLDQTYGIIDCEKKELDDIYKKYFNFQILKNSNIRTKCKLLLFVISKKKTIHANFARPV